MRAPPRLAPRLAVLLALVCVARLAAGADKGIIYLDDFTFDKVVDKNRPVIVKFDKEYPWGDEHDAFKQLAETVGEADTPLLVAGVPVSNSDTYPVNQKLAARFGLAGVKDEAFPRIMLFKRGADTAKPVQYPGALKSATDMLAWAVEQTGVFVGLKGQVKALDALARRFMAAEAAQRAALLSEAQAAADEVDTSASPDTAAYVEYYIKSMQRVLDKGAGYVQQEAKRLSKMAEDKSVAAAKRATFQWRLNVLGSFKPSAAASSDKTEL